MRILVVEDEKRLNDTICRYLTSEGYTVDPCYDGSDALHYMDGAEYDAVVLDIMLPGMDGISVLRRWRVEGKTVPVLLLTSKGEVSDRIHGLDSGADDYMVKPFSLEELAARLRVMIRRSGQPQADMTLTAGDLALDTKAKVAVRGGVQIKLTAKEYAILEYLMYNKGTVLSRERIEQHIWNYDYEGGSNIVDVYIRGLRKKLSVSDDDAPVIETVRGLGYVIR